LLGTVPVQQYPATAAGKMLGNETLLMDVASFHKTPPILQKHHLPFSTGILQAQLLSNRLNEFDQ
jgi:hypothetical protein